MWLALLAMLLTLVIGLWMGRSFSPAVAPYVGLAVLVLLGSGLRALRVRSEGRYSQRGIVYDCLSTLVAVIGLAWLGEQLSLGRVGNVPALTLALEVVLAARILGCAEQLGRRAQGERGEDTARKGDPL
ncbi:MAG: DUF1290 domain-containing protein [Armatimonadetes bacterium]|nr:DUF1290 domain-containing protein [Armatimonadota bacterium]